MPATTPHLSTAPASKPPQCGPCHFRQFCLPRELGLEPLRRLEQIISRRRRVLRHEQLFSMGHRSGSVFAVRLGHFKTVKVNQCGELQIIDFPMAGDLMGLESISSPCYRCTAVALEDSEVCEIPWKRLQDLFTQIPELMQRFHQIVAREIEREQDVAFCLATMRAERRLAVLLVSLSARYAARGLSPYRYQLRMPREDIGAYLGLTIESISRLLRRFRSAGWISLDNRDLCILDLAQLQALASGRSDESENCSAIPALAVPRALPAAASGATA